MALGSVESKISCIYNIIVVPNSASSKRPDQSFRITASDELRPDAKLRLSEPSSVATEKIDGTCVLIDLYRSRPWLWARHDRKPSKQADKRFKKYKSENPEVICNEDNAERGFEWRVEEDFREVPQDWKPAKGSCDKHGNPVPDSNGHIPGWVPVDPDSRQHLWHLSVVDLNQGLCLVLGAHEKTVGDGSAVGKSQNVNCGGEDWAVNTHSTDVTGDMERLRVVACDRTGSASVANSSSVHIGCHVETLQANQQSSDATSSGEGFHSIGLSDYSGRSFDSLQVSVQSLSAHLGSTFELIGTNVNANPYRIGSRESPLHFLVRHGSITFLIPPPIGYQELRAWFEEERVGLVEGVVWHCEEGRSLYKVHRHHMGLAWPLTTPPRLSTLPVTVGRGFKHNSFDLIGQFSREAGKTFESLQKLTLTSV